MLVRKCVSVVALIYACLVISGCAAVAIYTLKKEEKSQALERFEASMNSWVGSSQAELTAELGAPAETKTDEQGDTLLVYGENVEIRPKGYQEEMVNGIPERKSISSHDIIYTQFQKIFYVDNTGNIVKWAAPDNP